MQLQFYVNIELHFVILSLNDLNIKQLKLYTLNDTVNTKLLF